VADALGVPVGSTVYERSRVVTEKGQPTHTLAGYYRPTTSTARPLAESGIGPAGLGGGFMVLTRQGLEPDSIGETLVLQRRTTTRDGRVAEFARGIHAAARFAWTYTFKVPD
jgi:GntR family transcriptional regulator